MNKDEHYCCDNLEYEWRNARHTFYHCGICGQIIKIRNSEVNKVKDE